MLTIGKYKGAVKQNSVQGTRTGIYMEDPFSSMPLDPFLLMPKYKQKFLPIGKE